ncbi:hypothetical protein DFH06DRAFT_1421217 [Mycena polygramma]|nr:hypothetical protein DFH06DRAFT_1421217 [Mycena polygramma]
MSASASNFNSDYPHKRARALEQTDVPGGTSGTVTARFVAPMPEKFPREILDNIIEHSLPPDQFLRVKAGSRDRHSWSESMATKRAIPSVCKEWRKMYLKILYSDIAILEDYSLWALWRTLSDIPARRALVLGLTFMIYTPSRPGQSRGCITDILRWCTGLVRVDFLPRGLPYSLKSKGILPALPLTVTSLGLGSGIVVADGFALVQQTCATLQELRISLDGGAGANFLCADLVFPRLDSLQLTCSGGDPMPVMPLLRMPELKRLTFRVTDKHPPSSVPINAFYKNFLGRYGRELHYLAFPETIEDMAPIPPEVSDYGELLLLCPELRHVVLPSWAEFPFLHDDICPSMELVDIWRCSPRLWSHAVATVQRHQLRCAFPVAARMRSLDVHLVDTILDFPRAVDRVQPLVLDLGDGDADVPHRDTVPTQWKDKDADFEVPANVMELVQLRRKYLTHICDRSIYARLYADANREPLLPHHLRPPNPPPRTLGPMARCNAVAPTPRWLGHLTDDEDDEPPNAAVNALAAPGSPLGDVNSASEAGDADADADISDPSTHSDDDNDFDDDSDDTEPNADTDADADAENPLFPPLQPGLRRFLQATVPQRVLKRFGRAVAGMIFQLPDA